MAAKKAPMRKPVAKKPALKPKPVAKTATRKAPVKKVVAAKKPIQPKMSPTVKGTKKTSGNLKRVTSNMPAPTTFTNSEAVGLKPRPRGYRTQAGYPYREVPNGATTRGYRNTANPGKPASKNTGTTKLTPAQQKSLAASSKNRTDRYRNSGMGETEENIYRNYAARAEAVGRSSLKAISGKKPRKNETLTGSEFDTVRRDAVKGKKLRPAQLRYVEDMMNAVPYRPKYRKAK